MNLRNSITSSALKLRAAIAAGCLPLGVVGCASLEPMTPQGKWRDGATVHATAVYSPLGSYLYVRTSELLCAVKFSDLRGRPGAARPSAASYESICQAPNQGKALGALAIRNTGVVKGEGFRCHLNGGCVYNEVISHVVVMGPSALAVAWNSPNGLTFVSARRGEPFDWRRNAEIAPTAVNDEHRVDFGDLRVKWFNLSDQRRDLWIPLSELPN